jgi:flagellar hook-associated protein 2
MSTSSVSNTPIASTPTGSLSSLGAGSAQQITGLASGLDTNAIVAAEMAIAKQPLTALQNQSTLLTATNSAMTTIQTQLQALDQDVRALADPSLFSTSQAVTSSDTTRVSASSSSGAGIGGYQVSVSRLANSAQRTFSFTSPTSAGAISIDGQSLPVTSGMSISALVTSINSNKNLDVFAAATDSGTIVLSNRATGDTGSSFIQVTDPTGSLAEQVAKAKPGQDAAYSVDGVPGTSASNVVSGAIAGVSLTLTGITTTSGPITVNVSPPAASNSKIEAAVNAFTTQYNSVISAIQTQLTTPPAAGPPPTGTLYQDSGLRDLLSSMRSMMISPATGLPTGLSSMLDIGVSTGSTTGAGGLSSSSLSGNLKLNATTLESALSSNPTGVQSVMNSWSISLSKMINDEAGAGGTIDQRIQGDDSQVTRLTNRISSMQSSLNIQETQLVQQFAQLEAALSSNQSTSAWLTSQLTQLPGP